jgi:AraC-like DNA-binding protein
MHDFSSGSRASGARDVLSEVLADLRFTESSYGRCELTAPWGIEFEPQPQARFHLVVHGRCALREGSGPWRWLGAGDVVLLPHGAPHALASRPRGRRKLLSEMPLEEIGERTYRMRAGGAGEPTVLVCCSVGFAQPTMQPMLAMMPRLIILAGAATRDPAFAAIVAAMADEIAAERLGSAMIMVRLADVLIARVIRDWAESRRGDAQGWLAAIRDAQVGRALVAMHRDPGAGWSLPRLAREARMSRTVFAERFTSVVGVPPGRYLAGWRMQLARDWLHGDRVTVAEAATRLGYDSGAAFSRAFKRITGLAPSSVRRDGRRDRATARA